MKAQTPAKGISESSSWDDAKIYHIECDCTCEDHAVDTWIEADAEPDFGVNVTFYVKTWTPYSLSADGMWKRIKKAYNVLVKGVDTQEHGILLKEQAALNWVAAVQGAISDLGDNNDKT